MAEMSICDAMTVNGYRRRQPLSFCPTNASWGFDNRTVGLRVIEGGDSATRIEKRDAGADCNPYLLLAADIAAGLDGIEAAIGAADGTFDGLAFIAGIPPRDENSAACLTVNAISTVRFISGFIDKLNDGAAVVTVASGQVLAGRKTPRRSTPC